MENGVVVAGNKSNLEKLADAWAANGIIPHVNLKFNVISNRFRALLFYLQCCFRKKKFTEIISSEDIIDGNFTQNKSKDQNVSS